MYEVIEIKSRDFISKLFSKLIRIEFQVINDKLHGKVTTIGIDIWKFWLYIWIKDGSSPEIELFFNAE